MVNEHILVGDAVRSFITGGRSVFTVRNVKTGNRFTYKVISNNNGTYQVNVLCGSDNESSYRCIGLILPDCKFVHRCASRIKYTDRRVLAFEWLWSKVSSRSTLPSKVEVWHEGRCCRCGRLLTVPESIEAGIGPECAEKR